MSVSSAEPATAAAPPADRAPAGDTGPGAPRALPPALPPAPQRLSREAVLAAVRWDRDGLVPAVAQDVASRAVLMVAWMNRDALERTLDSGDVVYYSRSRGKLWRKGEESGHVQRLHALHVDCDGDTLVVEVAQTGPACHTNAETCFYRSFDAPPPASTDVPADAPADAPAVTPVVAAPPEDPAILSAVFATVLARKHASGQKSYVASLFAAGPERIHDKVLEEAAEVVGASREADPAHLVHEVADLWFHTLVTLGYHEVPVERVFAELARRFGRSGLDEKAARRT